MKIAITGGSGFVGSKLTRRLLELGHSILILDLNPPREVLSGATFIKTNLVTDIPLAEYLSCDAVVHLAGVNIFGRWTEKYKKLILESRTQTAQALIDALRVAGHGPRVFVSASAVGFYGEGGEAELNEESPNGSDFLAQVCAKWESVAGSAQGAGMRSVSIRTGVVLGPSGGMLAKLIPIFRLGFGGKIGTGNQWFSWIYLEDLINIYVLAITDSSLSGPVNAVAPNPVRNIEFTKILGRVLHRPTFFQVPKFVLNFFVGELSVVILASQKVIPSKLLSRKFDYQCPTMEEALSRSVN